MNASQAARKWGVSRQRVDQLLRAGRLPAQRCECGAGWVIAESARYPDAMRRGRKPKHNRSLT